MKMRFKDFIFPSNPSTIEISSSSNVQSSPLFDKNTDVQNVSINPIVVKGSGEFYGKDSEKNCQYLQHMLRLKTSGYLLVPSQTGIEAYFTEFSFTKNAQKNSVSYSFEFIEACNDKSETRAFNSIIALEGDNAFTIANRCEISVSDLMSLNDYKIYAK
jgi:hypothetical protein